MKPAELFRQIVKAWFGQLVWLWREYEYYAKRYPRLAVAAKIAVVYALFWMLCWRRLDPDFGWHLVSGQYYLHHAVPFHDIYTYTAAQFEWINHEWGNDLLFALIYNSVGYIGLSLIYAAVWTAALVVSATQRARLFVLLLGAVAVSPYATVRPVAWTVLGFSIFAVLLRSPKWRQHAMYLPLLMIIWANLHAGFIIGFFVIGYFAVRYRSRRLAAVLGLSVVASMVNPYGPRLYVEVFRTILDPGLHSQIAEWHTFTIFWTAREYVALWLAGFWLFGRKSLWSWLGLGQFMLIASLSATRNVPLLVVATLKDLDDYITKMKSLLPKQLDFRRQAVIGVMIIVAVGWLGYHVTKIVHGGWDREASYPVAVTRELRQHPCPGRIFNDYNYGGYMIWKLPDVPLYIDGRMPTWKDEHGKRYMDRYFAILDDSSARQREFKQYNVQCAVIGNSHSSTINALEDDGWTQIVNANNVRLLVAPGLELK